MTPCPAEECARWIASCSALVGCRVPLEARDPAVGVKTCPSTIPKDGLVFGRARFCLSMGYLSISTAGLGWGTFVK